MSYELTKDLETGNAQIDREHRELFDAVNRLVDSCRKGQGRSEMEPAIQFLLNYVDKHFSHEEQFMRDGNYPDFTSHKAFHERYTKRLRELVSAIPEAGPSISDLGNLNGHIAVLIGHIRSADKKLGAFLK